MLRRCDDHRPTRCPASHGLSRRGPATAPAPLLLPPELRLTPEQFALVCEANPEAVLELAADGQLITMTPTGVETGARNHSLSLALGLAVRHCILAAEAV